jgi:hypothetical protein
VQIAFYTRKECEICEQDDVGYPNNGNGPTECRTCGQNYWFHGGMRHIILTTEQREVLQDIHSGD